MEDQILSLNNFLSECDVKEKQDRTSTSKYVRYMTDQCDSLTYDVFQWSSDMKTIL